MVVDKQILFKEESYQIIGICMKVHRILGPGFLEAVYEEALEREFIKMNIPFQRQKKLDIYYEDQKLNKFYKADFICYDKILLEIKSVSYIPSSFHDQTKNNCVATKVELGLLINFGQPSLFYKRFINTKV